MTNEIDNIENEGEQSKNSESNQDSSNKSKSKKITLTQDELDSLIEKALKEHEKSKADDLLKSRLASYRKVQGCVIQDEEFLKKLLDANIAKEWLHLFTDDHKMLSIDEIWTIVRKGVK